jgi:hypothetical protein
MTHAPSPHCWVAGHLLLHQTLQARNKRRNVFLKVFVDCFAGVAVVENFPSGDNFTFTCLLLYNHDEVITNDLIFLGEALT